MKKYTKFLYSLIFLVSFYAKTNAQYVLKEADNQFSLYNFTNAIELYTEAYQAKKTLRAAQRLAEIFRLMRNYKQAESWYAIVQSMDGAKPDNHRWYAEMLKSNGKYTEAKLAFEKYEKALTDPLPEHIKQIDVWKASCDSAVKWMRNPKTVSILNEKALNSPQSDFGAIAHNNTILFTSDRPLAEPKVNAKEKPFFKFDGLTKLPNTKTYGATGNAYSKIYQKGNEYDQISNFNLNIKSPYHVGTPSFSADGTEVFFTITRVPDKVERIKNKPSIINLEIYSAKKLDGIWSEAIPFRYNKVQKWSVGDPCLTQDGNTLYFVSNMPGGLGGTDIYYCKRTANGEWGEAVNLTELNTAGNERSIAIADKYFYFSTDGLISMGGLDIYRARIKNGIFGKVENLGFPVNSPQDDFAFSLTNSQKRFLSSNREGGLGDDDIYSFLDTEKLKIPFESQIFDNETKLPLANAVITLKQFNGKTVKVETDQNGKYKLPLDEDSEYSILVDKTNYISTSKLFSTKGIDIDSTLKLDFVLNQIVIEKPIVLENIYYDFNKANIKPSSFKVLDSLVTMLKDNPTLWVELSSHTDAIGADAYNQWLSEMRAISAVRYIVRNGIDKSRIKAKGYGETKPVEKCTACTLRQNQLNRRTEFKIVKQ